MTLLLKTVAWAIWALGAIGLFCGAWRSIRRTRAACRACHGRVPPRGLRKSMATAPPPVMAVETAAAAEEGWEHVVLTDSTLRFHERQIKQQP